MENKKMITPFEIRCNLFTNILTKIKEIESNYQTEEVKNHLKETLLIVRTAMLEENILSENELRNILICLFVLHADLNKLRLTIDNLEFENQKNKHEIQMKNLIYDGYSYKKIDSDEEIKAFDLKNRLTKKSTKTSTNRYEIYHKTLSQTIQEIEKYLMGQGYEAIEFDINDVQHVPYGQTTRIKKDLVKNGQPQRSKLNAQIYRMDNGTYELNMYIG